MARPVVEYKHPIALVTSIQNMYFVPKLCYIFQHEHQLCYSKNLKRVSLVQKDKLSMNNTIHIGGGGM
jgi:hypothetical protein